MTDDNNIFTKIDALVAEEHELRAKAVAELSADDHERIAALDVRLDQCWDLLRQRRAKREYGENPDTAQARSADTVEGYLN